MAILDPRVPLRADHRFLKKLVDTGLDGADPTPAEFNRVSWVFSKLGGSWERIFRGSLPDVQLLKRVLKVALKHKFLSKKESWS